MGSGYGSLPLGGPAASPACAKRSTAAVLCSLRICWMRLRNCSITGSGHLRRKVPVHWLQGASNGPLWPPAKRTARGMASRQLKAGAARDRCRCDGTGQWQAGDCCGRAGGNAPPAHRMARVGRQADSHRPCRGAERWEGPRNQPVASQFAHGLKPAPLPCQPQSFFRWQSMQALSPPFEVVLAWAAAGRPPCFWGFDHSAREDPVCGSADRTITARRAAQPGRYSHVGCCAPAG